MGKMIRMFEFKIEASDNEEINFARYMSKCISVALDCFPEQTKRIIEDSHISFPPCGDIVIGARCPHVQECSTS